MKLLVLAQTPPPLHGQSVMVRTLVDGLPKRGIEVLHVNLRLSRDQADIGRWRTGKLFAAINAGLAARRRAREQDCEALYYVPAPGKRGALWRDLIVLGLARPACRRLVLHWHAAGLGSWLQSSASPIERRLAHRRLGRADLSIVLAESLRADAAALEPLHTAVVPNGIEDPGSNPPGSDRRDNPQRVLFAGAATAGKGLLDLIEAVRHLRDGGTNVELDVAGTPPTAKDAEAFARAAAPLGAAVHRAGFVTGDAKADLFRSCHAFCLPTYYPHEAQPLVLLEALAHDRPVVATHWRGIPDSLPPGNPLVPPRDPTALATALAEALSRPPPLGANRHHFLTHFTRERHLDTLATALRGTLPST